MSSSTREPVRREVVVRVPFEGAFEFFTEHMTSWWPRDNTFSGDACQGVVIEPWVGGEWYERVANGETLTWGRVLIWEPPRRVVLSWQISHHRIPEPDPAKASQVEVRFAPIDTASTRVELVHSAFENHGDPGARIWRAGMESAEGGWTNLLGRYVQALDG